MTMERRRVSPLLLLFSLFSSCPFEITSVGGEEDCEEEDFNRYGMCGNTIRESARRRRRALYYYLYYYYYCHFLAAAAAAAAAKR